MLNTAEKYSFSRSGSCYTRVPFAFLQALASGGLGSLAEDCSFLKMTRDEMAAAFQMEVTEMEDAAATLMKRRESLAAYLEATRDTRL